MPIDRLRYGRQIRLPEIGDEGQARLLAASVPLGGEGFVRTIEERYVRLAGAATAEAAGTTTVDVASLGLEHPAAREVGEGALRALVAIREVLGLAKKATRCP
jgi:molybdopterin/thiamine biosynthesis adenylyltransferase